MPLIGIINGGDVAVPHSMRRIPKTDEVTSEARAARYFVKILYQIGGGLRR